VTSDDLAWLTIGELAPLIRDRRISPVEVVRAMFDRVERLDLSGPMDAPPLVMPPPKRSVEASVRARLESARRELAETVAALDLTGIGPVVRFVP
jgi:hypothetical protein